MIASMAEQGREVIRKNYGTGRWIVIREVILNVDDYPSSFFVLEDENGWRETVQSGHVYFKDPIIKVSEKALRSLSMMTPEDDEPELN